ncbi:dTDP-4-dehydrorhamnose reductase [Bordetella sp. BOR01]|uniref:dTDP-4-dehydrorhamnose reductase n=1 Tax=Bordetella sp. BOR01 TaxID=2854779 RepID=UPI001C489E14|nr:dTDP-4-dehydrorhamnose reductase [Bordetella sp. BOR01]MBV7485457.1 dTDP-4-dehydrorhamnose reductase [Bordetella sp. BOR01]
MKILLLGATGQIGNALRRTLLPLGSVVAPPRPQADLADLGGLQALLRAQAPDLIVNAAAYTAVDPAQADPAPARRVNGEAVAVMAAHAHTSGTLLVHFSTDYVFDGAKPAAYLETDAPNPLNEYGRSKLAGEQAIQASGCRALVLRTSWIYAAHGQNFVKTVLQLARQRDELRVVADQVGAPTSAELVADVTALALAAHRRQALPDGLYHLSAAGSATWHELACRTVRRARQQGMALRLLPEHIHAIATEDYPLPAPRPHNSRLDTRRLSDALGLVLPDWTVHLDRTIDCLARCAPGRLPNAPTP